MIGRLAGRIDWVGPDHLLLDVGGVGYVVHVSDRTRMALPGAGAHAALYTDLLVREDLLQLYGFLSLQEKEWHRLLTSVQGIGAKASLAILGALGPDGVSRAIALGDWAAIKAAPGVGPKLAQRVVNELKEKAAGVMAMGAHAPAPSGASEVASTIDPAPPAGEPSATGGGDQGTGAGRANIEAGAARANIEAGAGRANAQADAVSALLNLGYAQAEAATAVASASGEGAVDAAELIRAALRLLAPSER